jgi:hypothetical protein
LDASEPEFGAPMTEYEDIIINSIRNKDAIILEITPKFYATWDHGKVKRK